MFNTSSNKIVRNNSNKTNKTVLNLFKRLKNNKSRNSIYMPNIKAIGKLIFLNPNTKKTFNPLKQAFIKVLIFNDFYFEYYI